MTKHRAGRTSPGWVRRHLWIAGAFSVVLLSVVGHVAYRRVRRVVPTLLRPLARQSDPRFAGRLPAFRILPSSSHGSELDRDAAERIRRLWQPVRDPSDIGAFVDGQERLLWIGFGGGVENAASALLRIVPDHPQGLELLAAVRYEQGRLREALPLAEAALAQDPRRYLALVYRAAVRETTGAFEDASADLRRAASLEPDRPEVPFFLGQMLLDRSRFEEASAWLRQIPSREPSGGRMSLVRTAAAYADLFAGLRPLEFHPSSSRWKSGSR